LLLWSLTRVDNIARAVKLDVAYFKFGIDLFDLHALYIDVNVNVEYISEIMKSVTNVATKPKTNHV